MKIEVHVKIRSKKEGVENIGPNTYSVRVNVAPVDGKANERVIELLAKHFNVPKSKVCLLSGTKSKRKLFEV